MGKVFSAGYAEVYDTFLTYEQARTIIQGYEKHSKNKLPAVEMV
jgi:hypothetical protein